MHLRSLSNTLTTTLVGFFSLCHLLDLYFIYCIFNKINTFEFNFITIYLIVSPNFICVIELLFYIITCECENLKIYLKLILILIKMIFI